MNRTTRYVLPTGLLLATLTLTACGGSGHDMNAHDMGAEGMGTTSGANSSAPGMTHDMHGATTMSGMGAMDGMGTGGDGLADTVTGYRLSITEEPMGDMAMPIAVTISRAGRPVTQFMPEQTKLMHLYLIRSDLTGFQHLHPTMDASGVWSTPSVQVPPGSYRLYTQVIPGGLSQPIVLSRPITVAGPGPDRTQAAPTPAASEQVHGSGDGYTVTVRGRAKAGTATQLVLSISRAGRPVTDLQPYLDTYAHVTAIHAGDLAFAHLHPEQPVTTGPAPGTLSLHAQLPRPGVYRLFVQFQTSSGLHNVPVTVTAN